MSKPSGSSHKRTAVAKRMIFINALNSSRPRTEEGYPILYSQIKSRLRYRNDEDLEVSLHRSVRAISDPDLPGCLVHGDEEFFKNAITDTLQLRQDSYGSNERLDASPDLLNKENRKSVRDVVYKYEGLTVGSGKGSAEGTLTLKKERPLPLPKPRSLSDFTPVKRKPIPAPRKKSNSNSTSPYQVVELTNRSTDSTISNKENPANVRLRLSKISSTSSIGSKDDEPCHIEHNAEYDEVQRDEQTVNDVFDTQNVNGRLDETDGDPTNARPTTIHGLKTNSSLCTEADELSPLPEIQQLSHIKSPTTPTSEVVRSRFISDPTPLDITVYKMQQQSHNDTRDKRLSGCRDSRNSNNSWYSEDCGWDSDEFENSDEDTSLLDSTKEDEMDEKSAVEKKIFNTVNEILTTERTYVKRLYLLEKVFYERLLSESKKSGSSFSDKIVNDIFSKLSPIYEFHTQILLPDLENRMTSWSTNAKIGDIFRTLGHCLKLYSHYVANFDNATKLVNSAMKKHPKFCSTVEEIQLMAESQNLSLQHHMLEPIQRVPRYKLLLSDYLKRLPEDSADRCEAEESLVVISKAAEHANDSMKHMDKFKKLLELQDRITEGLHGETLVTAGRVFIKEGDVSKIAARSDHRMPRTLLLFNDLLLCCGKTGAGGSKLKVKQIMDMDGMKLMDGNEVELSDKHAFRIRSRQRVLDLAANNDQDKQEWLDGISIAISDYVEKRGPTKNLLDEEFVGLEKSNSLQIGLIAPVWVKDDDVSMCMLCASRFWLANRRHHCRGCGRACCENCSKYKAPLPYANHAFKRVCFSCFKKVSNEKANQSPKSKDISTLKNDRRRRNSNIPAFISGELQCKQPNKGWSRDWLALLPDFVLYFHRKKQDPKAFLTLPIPGWTVDQSAQGSDTDGDKTNVFKIFHPNLKESSYYFEADDKETKDRWLEALSYASQAEIPPSSVIVDEFRADI